MKKLFTISLILCLNGITTNVMAESGASAMLQGIAELSGGGLSSSSSGSINNSTASFGNDTRAIRDQKTQTRVSETPPAGATNLLSFRTSRPINFAVNSSRLTQSSKNLLNELAGELSGQLVGNSVYLSLDGHASADGSASHNLALSQERAKAVKRYLIRSGMEDSMISSRGFGEDMLLREYGGSSQAQRRVEFVFYKR